MNQHLKQAIAAARAGKDAQAKVLLARVIKDEPDNVNAWFLLSSLADTEEQKVQHLEKVLELQPGHAAASQLLGELAPALPEAEEVLPDMAETSEDTADDAAPDMFPLPEIDLPEEDNAPEDPDEAMAWLERLAADQGAPMNELPTMFEETADDETADTVFETPVIETEPEYEEIDSAPEDPDEAMAWLERLAADQGAPMDELPSLSEEEGPDETADDEFSWLEKVDVTDDDYLDNLPTLVDEGEEDTSWEFEEEAEESVEESTDTAKTLAVSDESTDFVSQAQGDSIPSWLVGDEDYILTDTVISEPAAEAEEETAEPENLPDWLNELPDEDWAGEEGEKSGQVVWKAGEGDESLKPEPPAKETKETKPAGKKTAEAKDNTTVYLALLAIVAVILIFAILYLLVNQPF